MCGRGTEGAGFVYEEVGEGEEDDATTSQMMQMKGGRSAIRST